ncbi:MAG: alpha/beta hydrolase-fold protein [Bacteroidota bacterium]
MAFSKKSFQIKFCKLFGFSAPTQQNFEAPLSKTLFSEALDRSVRVDLYLPPGHRRRFTRRHPCLIFNDGQDMKAMQLAVALRAHYGNRPKVPFVVAAVHAGDRMQEYGTAAQADYLNRGSKASQYTQFLLNELLPVLQSDYGCKSEGHSIAGCSLGGLSAFDVAWHHPDVFSKVGIFSGSLWWRSQPFRADAPDADRIAHQMVEEHRGQRPALQFWLQAGTKDETSDRNNNGIIDAIDDTLALMSSLKSIGYPEQAMTYIEVENGEHNAATWAKVLPDFLRWLTH